MREDGTRGTDAEPWAPQNVSPGWHVWGPGDARSWVGVPSADEDKYSRGVLGVITGSEKYPGAAVLSVDSAVRTGIGMVRYFGPSPATQLVLARRPEAVCQAGHVSAWLVGSGMGAETRDSDLTAAGTDREFSQALESGLPVVLDAGALDVFGRVTGPFVVTPHYRELSLHFASVPGPSPGFDEIAAVPWEWAARAADSFGGTVLLKGSTTYIASPGGSARLAAVSAPNWLATAGTGDVLAGIVGSLIATHSDLIKRDSGVLAPLAASAAVIHGLAGERASRGGPVAALDVAEAVPATIADLIAVAGR